METLSEEAVSDYVLWFQSMVHFHKFNVDVSTADDRSPTMYPEPKATAYAVRDIMHHAGVDFHDISRHGAVLMTNVIFDCDLDLGDCHSKLESKFVDGTSGYNFAKTSYYTDNSTGIRYRDLTRYYGLRFVANAVGNGSRISAAMILLHVSFCSNE